MRQAVRGTQYVVEAAPGARDAMAGVFYELRAFFLPPPRGEVAAGRRGVVCLEVGSRKWEVAMGK